MLHTGSFEIETFSLFLPWSWFLHRSFCLVTWLLRAGKTVLKNTADRSANWTATAFGFRVSSLCKCLVSA